MAGINKVLLMGNLTAEPDFRHTPDGTAVTSLRLAVNESFKNKAGETVENTTYADVETWGKTAENCARFLKKGSGVFIDGRLRLDQWKTPEGENRQKLFVRADNVQFMDKKED